jgi:hypothetical protein
VTLQLYDHGAAIEKKGACCAGQDIHDARTAAERMGIAHYVLDYESRFRQAVIEDFADSYLRGETPIPCIRCNQTVKFRDLLDMARDLGAAAMATAAAEKFGSDYALSVTGYAGPGGGTDADPVGTVYIGYASPTGVWSRRVHLPGDRVQVKLRAVNTALDLMRRQLNKYRVEDLLHGV